MHIIARINVGNELLQTEGHILEDINFILKLLHSLGEKTIGFVEDVLGVGALQQLQHGGFGYLVVCWVLDGDQDRDLDELENRFIVAVPNELFYQLLGQYFHDAQCLGLVEASIQLHGAGQAAGGGELVLGEGDHDFGKVAQSR